MLTRADVILHFLGWRHPEAGRLGDGDRETAAESDRWYCLLPGDLHMALLPVFTPSCYMASTDPEALAAAVNAGLGLVRARPSLLDVREWMAGGKRTIIEACVLPTARLAPGRLDELADGSPAVKAYLTRKLARSGVREFMETGRPIQ